MGHRLEGGAGLAPSLRGEVELRPVGTRRSTLGNLAALPQRNVVRLLAYSSIAQSGYMLMGIAALEASDEGLPALVYYAFAYAAMNLAAFAVVLAVQREQGSVDLDAFRGLAAATRGGPPRWSSRSCPCSASHHWRGSSASSSSSRRRCW